MKTPSQKLIKEVLNKEMIMIQYDDVSSLLIDTLEGSYVVNIYELMHKMKEWAVNKGFVVLSRNDSIGYRWTVILSIPSNLNFNKPFEQLSEFEAVTKACEWILK